MINQYKRLDVFKCSIDAHRHFNGRVSVYHVLKEKQCYPQGCLYFLWRCSRMEKGNRCIHKYQYIGKNCKGCTYYDEEKVHLQPECRLSKDDYDRFLTELDNYETWIESIQYKRLPVAGRISIVKPWFEHTVDHQKQRTRCLGYLLIFRRGFIGMQSFNDTFYIRIPEKRMRQYQFQPKMKVEITGEIRVDQGRLVIQKPGQIEILSSGWGKIWKKESALVAVRTASLLKEQPDTCMNCPWGALADSTDLRENPPEKHRNLFCLKGFDKPEDCHVRPRRSSRSSATADAQSTGDTLS